MPLQGWIPNPTPTAHPAGVICAPLCKAHRHHCLILYGGYARLLASRRDRRIIRGRGKVFSNIAGKRNFLFWYLLASRPCSSGCPNDCADAEADQSKQNNGNEEARVAGQLMQDVFET
jgi:hypothetical protein